MQRGLDAALVFFIDAQTTKASAHGCSLQVFAGHSLATDG